MPVFSDEDFVRESNRIEGILRDPTPEEMAEFHRFAELETVTIEDIQHFVSIYQPRFPVGVLRSSPDIPGVRVGDHIAPPSGPDIRARLDHLVRCANARTMSAYDVHVAYEQLHPFTDGNGRSGRMLWRWQMGRAPIGFLHQFYYQTLHHFSEASRIQNASDRSAK
jgi:Fic family protein